MRINEKPKQWFKSSAIPLATALALAAVLRIDDTLALARLALPPLFLSQAFKGSDFQLFKPKMLDEQQTVEAHPKDIIELEKKISPKVHQANQKAIETYIDQRARLTSRSSFPDCSKVSSSNSNGQLVEGALCETLQLRWKRSQPVPAEQKVATTARNKKERAQIAQALAEENWGAAAEYSYRQLVGIVSVIPSLEELIRVGTALSQKSNCVGAAAATALAYKLEESFPDANAMKTAMQLYAYGAKCGTDFASATAAYRLSLLKILNQDCSEVSQLMKKVESIPDATQFLARARYWRAYCAESTGNKEESKDARELLAQQHTMSFHNLAANAGQPGALDWMTKETSTAFAYRSLIRPDLNAYVRAFEFLQFKGRKDLAAEFADLNFEKLQELEPEVRLHITLSLQRDASILVSFRFLSQLFSSYPRLITDRTLRLFYPLKYFDLVQPQAGEGLDPLLILALMRQESAFNPDAMSRVGARGLMQVMPATARTISSVRKANSLLKPELNVEIGTKYFKKRLSQFSGDVEHTLAAYNAGAGRIEDWKKRYVTTNKVLFIDLIPYRETREYVANILRNYYWYTRLYTPTEKDRPKPFVDSSLQRRFPASASKAKRLKRELSIARAQSGSVDIVSE